MANIVGILFLLAFVGGIGLYIFRSYAPMLSRRARAKYFGLPRGELVAHECGGEFATDISLGHRVAWAATAAAVGVLFGGIAVGTVRALGVYVILTTRGRLLLSRELENGMVARVFFASPAEVRITVRGPDTKKVNGLPAVVVEFVAADGVPFYVRLAEPGVGPLLAWSTYR